MPSFFPPASTSSISKSDTGSLGDINMNVQRLVDHLHKIGYPKPVSARKYVYIYYRKYISKNFNVIRQFEFFI